jgi:hypothetical protein
LTSSRFCSVPKHCCLAVSAHAQMPEAEAKPNDLANLFLQRLDASQPDVSSAPGSAEAPAPSSGGSGMPFGAGSSGAAPCQAASTGTGAMHSEASGSRPCTPEPLPAGMELQGAASAPVAAVAPTRWPPPRHVASQSLAPTGSAPFQHSSCYSMPAAHHARRIRPHRRQAQQPLPVTGTSADGLGSAVGRKRKLSNTG